MSRSVKALIAVSLLLATAGCATAPSTYNVTNSRTFDMSYDEVWEDIVAAFASRNIQVKNIAKDSGVIYAESARFDDSMADCGKPGLFVVQGRRANFNVFVTRSGGKPNVSVNTEFTEIRNFQGSITTVSCNSKGVLEGMILQSIAP